MPLGEDDVADRFVQLLVLLREVGQDLDDCGLVNAAAKQARAVAGFEDLLAELQGTTLVIGLPRLPTKKPPGP